MTRSTPCPTCRLHHDPSNACGPAIPAYVEDDALASPALLSRPSRPGSPWGRWLLASALGAGVLLVAAVLVAAAGAKSVEAKALGGGSGWSLGASPTPTPTPPIKATYLTRRGAEFHVKPEEARVTVNGRYIGRSDDWDDAGGGNTYFFKQPGWYYVKLNLRGHETTWVKVIVDPDAKDKIVKVKQKLHRYR